MPVRTDGPAPYAPPQTVLQLINGYRDRGLATPFTTDVLVRAGVTESLVPRVLRSMQGLDLIDEAGNPTAAFESLRRSSTDDFKQRLEELVRAVYAEVFQFTDPAKDPPSRVADAFRAFNPPGQRARMVTLFLGLCEAAGIIPEGSARKQAPPGTGKKRERQTRSPVPRGGERPASFSTKAQLRNQTGDFIPLALSGFLASLPSPDDGWSQARRDKWLQTFEAVLDFAIPIHEERSAGADEDGQDDDE